MDRLFQGLFIVIVSLILSSFSFFQGYNDRGDLLIYQAHTHDALWHLGLMEVLKSSVPPENPIYSGETLRGYHYFTDLTWNFLSYLTFTSGATFYLTISPFILALGLTLSTLKLFGVLFKDKLLVYLGVLLSLLGSGFSYLAPLFFPNSTTSQSVFWLDQPINWLTNQQLALSIIMVNIILILVFSNFKKWWVFAGGLMGLLAGVKIYALPVVLSGVSLLSLVNTFKDKSFKYIGSLGLALLISLLIILTIGSNSNFPFIFEPGFFIKTMYEGENRLNYSTWELRRQTFLADQNYLRVVLLWLEGLGVFLLGNFGLKILGLFSIFKIYRDQRSWVLISFILASIITPMLFIQKGIVWNTIQFMHYAQIPLVIMLILGLSNLLNKKIVIALLTVILIFSLPTSISTFLKTLDYKNYDLISKEVLKLSNLVKDLPKGSIIILDSDLAQTSVVPAFSGRSVYFADPIINDILLTDYSEREKRSKLLESIRIGCQDNEYLLTNKTIFKCQNGKFKL